MMYQKLRNQKVLNKITIIFVGSFMMLSALFKLAIETSVFLGMMTAAAVLSLLGLWGLVEVGKLGFYLLLSKHRNTGAFR